MPPELIVGFIVASLIVIVAPGPDNLMVLGQGISRGQRAGVLFAIGCGFGCLLHTLWATLGVSALIASSETAFNVLKIVGALYLFYLGFQTIFRSNRGLASTARLDTKMVKDSSLSFVVRGFLSNAVNPKVALFFLAFLPQFTAPEAGSIAFQMAVLGVLFTILTTALFISLGYFAGTIGLWLSGRAAIERWLNRMVGGLFIGLGLRLVFAEQPD